MRFPTMWHFDMKNTDEPVQPPFKLRNSKYGSVSSSHRIFKRLAKALIRLRVCAGWSEHLLIAHTTFLEISCCGSFIIYLVCNLYGSTG